MSSGPISAAPQHVAACARPSRVLAEFMRARGGNSATRTKFAKLSSAMKVFVVFFVVFLASVAIVGAENEVVDVSEDGAFGGLREEHDFVFVKFFSQTCGHCKRMAPAYEAAAKELKDLEPQIVVAEVDCGAASDLCMELGIQAYPTMKLFKGDLVIDYKGGREQADLVGWMLRKFGSAVTKLASPDDVGPFLEKKVAVVGFFDDLESDEARSFYRVAETLDDVSFAYAMDAKVLGDRFTFSAAPQVALFKRFDEPIVKFDGELTEEKLSDFVNSEKVPLVIEFLPETVQMILGPARQGRVFFLFVEVLSEDPDYLKTMSKFGMAAKELKARGIRFAYIDVKKKSSDRICTFFDVDTEAEKVEPVLYLFSMDETLKYKAEITLELESIVQFLDDVDAKKVLPVLRSEPIPPESGKPLKELVGLNINDVVYDTAKNALVMFYSDGCGHCKALKPTFAEVAEHYADDSDVVIANFLVGANEFNLKGLQVRGIPTVAFWPANTNELNEYNGDRTKDDIIEWVENLRQSPNVDSAGKPVEHDEL